MNVYYYQNGSFKVYNGEVIENPRFKPKSGFELPKTYEISDDGLKKYHKNLTQWYEEINQHQKLSKRCYSNDSAITYMFFSQLRGDKEIEYDTITYDESTWFDKCYKSGLIYGKKGDYENVNSYDFTKFYSSILGGYNTGREIPITEGIKKTITKLPEKLKDLQYGIYRVSIKSDNPDIKAIYSFSKFNHYTHIDIQYAGFLKSRGYIDSIELIVDDKPNALVYDKLIKTQKIFKRYVGVFTDLSLKYPKNKLLKAMLSRLWGRLMKKNDPKSFTKEQLFMMDENELSKWVSVKEKYIYDEEDYTKQPTFIAYMVNSKSMYQYNLRLQPFLSSHARKKMGNKIINNFDDIIRVQQDGVIFKNTESTINLDKGEFIIDDKYHNKNVSIINSKKVKFF